MSIRRVLLYIRVEAQMREWRALGYNQVASLRSANPSARLHSIHEEKLSENMSAKERGVCAEPLANRPLIPFLRDDIFSSCVLFIRHWIYHEDALRIFLIVSGETGPMYSPSSHKLKLSKSNSFLSSIPIRHTTSSSIMSDMKYCGSPLE